MVLAQHNSNTLAMIKSYLISEVVHIQAANEISLGEVVDGE